MVPREAATEMDVIQPIFALPQKVEDTTPDLPSAHNVAAKFHRAGFANFVGEDGKEFPRDSSFTFNDTCPAFLPAPASHTDYTLHFVMMGISLEGVDTIGTNIFFTHKFGHFPEHESVSSFIDLHDSWDSGAKMKDGIHFPCILFSHDDYCHGHGRSLLPSLKP